MTGLASRMRRWQTPVLALAGIAGLFVVAAAVAPIFGWTVVRLATGSMTPTYPTDSILLVHTVDASEVGIGDVVTVASGAGALVTHRVIATEPAGTGTRLQLQGDANAIADPQPYLVGRVGLVVGGLPFGGQVVDALRSTPGVVGASLVAALLVAWAWWPVARTRPAHRASRAGAT